MEEVAQQARRHDPNKSINSNRPQIPNAPPNGPNQSFNTHNPLLHVKTHVVDDRSDVLVIQIKTKHEGKHARDAWVKGVEHDVASIKYDMDKRSKEDKNHGIFKGTHATSPGSFRGVAHK